MWAKGFVRNLPLRTALVFLVSIAVVGIAYAAIAFVSGRADESRQSVAAYAHLEAHVNEQSVLEWRSIAEQQLSPHTASQLRLTRSEVMRDIADAERLDNDADQGKGVRPLYHAYDRAVEREFRLIEAGKRAQAKRFDEKRVDPSFDTLEDVIHEQIRQQSKAADRHNLQARLGSAGALLVAAFLVALLFSRRDKAQLVLGRLSRQNESILNAAGDGIYGLDAEDRVTFANPAAARMTGHEVGELLGRGSQELIHHGQPNGAPHEDDVYWRKDGTSFPVEFTSTPIVEGGKVAGAVVVFKDITERREVERAKDEFTSVVSHELRTPLTSIRGSLGLLESGVLGPLPEKGQRMVEIAVENTDRLVRLINDILDIERIDSGKIDMNQQPCDAAELIERAIEVVEQVAVEAEVMLTADAQPAALFADPDRVLQTLTNLISNAVKFSPKGSSVRVSSVHRASKVLFEVKDEGRGIPADKLATIFDRFQQVDASDSREKGGTGLGLAISRTIVEHHGGRIWVESELGVGSTFSFVLPAQSTNGSPPVDRAEGGPAILICDDDASVVEVVGVMLEQYGYRVIPAHSGEQALERALAERPDAILLDLLMPGMSGWETAAALGEHQETREVPILILSVLSEAESEGASERFDDWIQKPLDEAVLFKALERAVGPRGEQFKVLIVEDDRDLAAILTATFERHGIETFLAADGREAIELSQQVLPDLLVLDVGLPETDGFQVVDWLRRHDRLRALPIAVYTARELDEADRERLRLGATTEFLTKGRITPQDFEQRVMRLLGRLTRDRSGETSDESEAHLATKARLE